MTIIGAGNVAWHLSHGLSLDFRIHQVISRSLKPAKELAKALGCSASTSLEKLELESDYILIAVNDQSIANVVQQIPLHYEGIVLHTSGSTSIDALNKFQYYGVLYPLQTFSKAKEVRLDKVPFFVEGNSKKVLEPVTTMARTLSTTVHQCNSEERLRLHMAAVIACNFSNYMMDWAFNISGKEHFKHLIPLILETVEKAIEVGPQKAQTGPAKRGDLVIIDKHMALLSNSKEKELYELISKLIMQKHV